MGMFNQVNTFRTLINQAQFIRDGSTDAVLEIQYFDFNMAYSGRDSITVSTTANTLEGFGTVPSNAHFALIYVGPADTPDANIRWLGNAAPTTSQGTPQANGTIINWTPFSLGARQAIPNHIDDRAFVLGSNGAVPIAALADDTSSDTVGEGDAGIVRMTLERMLRGVPSARGDGSVTSPNDLPQVATVYALDGRSSSPASVIMHHPGGNVRGCLFEINVTVGGVGQTLRLNMYFQTDTAVTTLIKATTAVDASSAGVFYKLFYPMPAATASDTAAFHEHFIFTMPARIRPDVIHNNSNAVTYSIKCHWIS